MRSPPAIKKQLKLKPSAPPLDFAKERIFLNTQLGIAAFKKAETEYWKHRDLADVPDQGRRNEWSGSWNNAVRTASRKGPPPASKPSKASTAPDYAHARTALEHVVELGKDHAYAVDARRMLASIALREGKPRDAIRWCKPLTDEDAAPLMAWAYQQLGNRKELAAWLARTKGPTYRGFLAELQGDDEGAIRAYLEVLGPEWDQVPFRKAYGELRLRRMAARLGKAAIERVKESLAQQRDGGKIAIASVADFHARFADIAAALRKQQKITEPPKPMSEAAIAKLRLPTSRASAKVAKSENSARSARSACVHLARQPGRSEALSVYGRPGRGR